MVGEEDELRSYDITALFTSVPVDREVAGIKKELKAEINLYKRTSMSPSDVARFLEFCLSCTYYVFKKQFYHQIHGAAMG